MCNICSCLIIILLIFKKVALNTLKEEMNQTILSHDAEKETLNNTLLEVQDNLSKLLQEIDLLKKENEVDLAL